MSQTVEEMLQPFTDPECTRYGLGHQWIKDGWRMATDARVAVRVHTGEPDLTHGIEGKQLRFPDVPSLFSPYAAQFADGTTPFKSLASLPACSRCNSTGRVQQNCTECFMGEFHCDKCGHEYPCESCDGTGKQDVACPGCKNLKVNDEYEIDIMFLYRMAALPNCEIFHVPEGKVSIFRFAENGQGIVCWRASE